MTTVSAKHERKILERLLKRGGATLVISSGGDVKITTFFNTKPLRNSGIRHD